MPLAPLTLLPILILASHFSPLLELFSVLVAAPLIVRAALALPRAAWAVWLGALSYPLYATHGPVMRLAELAGVPMVSSLLASIVVAIAVTVVFEKRAKISPAAATAVPSAAP